MTYAWATRYRFAAFEPGKLDLFVLTLIDGKPAGLVPTTEFSVVLEKARAFHRQHKCQVKVLSLTGLEMRNLFGVGLLDRPKPIDDAVKQEMIDTLNRIVRESNDAGARIDAAKMLTDMGEALA